MLELRDRALLIQNTLMNQHNKKNLEDEEEREKLKQVRKQMENFVLLSKKVQSVINNMNSLLSAGYPEDAQV
jgi:hypothetical protein